MTNVEVAAYTFQRSQMAVSFVDPEAPRWIENWREAVRIRLKYGDEADWEISLGEERKIERMRVLPSR